MSAPPPLLRPAEARDCAAMRAIYNHYVLHDTCTYQTEPETLEERLAWLASHGPRHVVLVAEAEGSVVGWGSLSPYHVRPGYRATGEDSVYLDPAWRGRKLGSALLARLVDAGRTLGHHAVVAAISAEQSASVALHAKYGFTEAGRLREVGFKLGQWLDVLYMQLVLGPAPPDGPP